MMALLLGQISKRLSLFWRLSMVAKPPELLTIVAATALLAPLSAFGQGLVGLTPDSSAASTQTTVAIDTQNPGVAVVSNGQRSGPNLYHRFDQFDTTKDNLNRVFFDMGTRGPDNVVNNMIVGVSSTSGSHISVPLVLSQPADLIFMSPYGITVSGQAGFGWGSIAGDDVASLSTIVLTTANRVIFDNTQNNFFEVFPQDLSTIGNYPSGMPLLPEGFSGLGGIDFSFEQSIKIMGGELEDDTWLSLSFEKRLMLLDFNNLVGFDRGPSLYSPVLVQGFSQLFQNSSDPNLRGGIYGRFWILHRQDQPFFVDETTMATTNLKGASALVLKGNLYVEADFSVFQSSYLYLEGDILFDKVVQLFNGASLDLDLNRATSFFDRFYYPRLNVFSGKAVLKSGIEVLGDTIIRASDGQLLIEAPYGPAIWVIKQLDELPANYGFQKSNYVVGNEDLKFNLNLEPLAPPRPLEDQSRIVVNGPILLGGGNLVKSGFGRVELNSEQNSYTGVTEVLGGHLQVKGPVPSQAFCNNASSNICDRQSSKAYFKDRYNFFADPDFLAYVRKEYGFEPMAGVDPATYVPSFQEFSPAPPTLVSWGFAPSEQSIETSNSSQKEYIKSLQALAPELFHGGMPTTPSPQEIQAGMQRQVQRIRSLAIGSSQALLQDQSRDQSSWIASTTLAGSRSALPAFHAAAYQPAVVYLRFSEDHGPAQAAQPPALGGDSFLDFTLIPLEGPVQGIRVPLSKKLFFSQLRELYASLARQDRLDTANPASASRQLYQQLIAPIVPFLEAKRVTTLLIAADQGLQAVPLAALHDGQQFFGERYAFSVTPSLALTSFNSSTTAGQPIFVAGSSQFDAMAPLPLVPQEVQTIGAKEPTNIFLNRNFTPEVFFEMAGDPHFSRVHVATHAEFLPGGPAASYIYSGVGPMPMSLFSRLRLMRKGAPLDLITLSACRTALGDPSSELGFAGMAIQAGARSAAGTLWYVDDVASSAFFMQMYRYLNQGVPKAEALQLTRQMFLRRQLHLEGDRLLSADGNVLLEKLDSVQQRRVHDGLDHPYFWAGIELAGSPW